MSVNGLKNMISKLEETGGSGDIPGTRGRRLLNPERVQQIDDAIATTSSSSGARIMLQESARSVAQILSFPWSTEQKTLRHILRPYPYKIKMLQELKTHTGTQIIDLANFFFLSCRKSLRMTLGYKESCGQTRRILHYQVVQMRITTGYGERDVFSLKKN
ncbi:hypothetical protein TNCV_1380461 [Trichonephila clavipes]|nr:hypothetical protein TNCV_1380461 [Trichonephila clavipes]